MARNTLLGMIVSWNWMGEEIFTFLHESKYSVSLITVPFCPVAPCPLQILAGVLYMYLNYPFLPTQLNHITVACFIHNKQRCIISQFIYNLSVSFAISSGVYSNHVLTVCSITIYITSTIPVCLGWMSSSQLDRYTE